MQLWNYMKNWWFIPLIVVNEAQEKYDEHGMKKLRRPRMDSEVGKQLCYLWGSVIKTLLLDISERCVQEEFQHQLQEEWRPFEII